MPGIILTSARFSLIEGWGTSATPASAFPFTLAIWAHPINAGTTIGFAMQNAQRAVTNQHVSIGRDNGTDGWSVFDAVSAAGGANSATNEPAGTPMRNGRWHHVALVASSSTSRALYVNGKLRVTGTAARAVGTLDCINFGSGSSFSINFWSGYLALPSIHAAALTDIDIWRLSQGEMPWRIKRSNAGADLAQTAWPNFAERRDITGSYPIDASGSNRVPGSFFLPPQLARYAKRKRLFFIPAAGGAALAGAAAQAFTNSATPRLRSFLAGASAQAFLDSGSIHFRARITGTAAQAFTDTGALFGRSKLSAIAAQAFANSGTTRGRASLAGTAAEAFSNTASMFGRISLAGAAPQNFTNSADLTAFSGAQISGTAAQSFANSASLQVRAFLGGTASQSFALAGTMSAAAAAPIAGTAVQVFINSATLRTVAQLTGTAAQSFSNSAALEAPSYLAGTAAQQFTASGDISGALPVVAKPATVGAGRSRRRRRYFIEVDGQPVFVEGEAEAQALLDTMAERAERKVERAEKRAIVRARATGEAPKVARPRSLPRVELPRALREQIGNPFEERVRAAMRDAEIRAYLEWQAEMDDEEALLALVA